MCGAKYFLRIGLLALIVLLSNCKQEQAAKVVEEAPLVVIDTTVLPEEKPKIEIEGGLHQRITQRLDSMLIKEQHYQGFVDWLRFEAGPFTAVLPRPAFDGCDDCSAMNWKDYLLDESLDSPTIARELNGLRTQFTAKSTSGKTWTFHKASDSLLVTDFNEKVYLLWQTDITATNGLLHILKPLSSQ